MDSSKGANYLNDLRSILQLGAVRQLIFMLGTAVSIALGIVLYMSIQEPTYRPLDYQVNQQNMSVIADTLEKAGIQYKVNERDGSILVPAKDIQTAKLKLSAAGIAKDDGFGFGFLNEQNNLANSQFLENARYLRALENDLAKTISSIEGISGARVHIAVPQNNTFADENGKVTASVVLNIAPSLMSDREKIRAIMQIIADSVPGLDPKDVAITDQYGHFLSDGMDMSTVYNAQQLSYQNSIQNYYEQRIQSMVAPIIGDNKVTVRVNADIDFTQREDAQEDYDPDKKAVRSEQSMSEEDDSSGASGAPGSLSNAPPEEGDSKASGGSGGSGRKSHQNTKNYEISKTVVYKKSNFAKIKSLSVAVVVDNDMEIDPKTKQSVSKPISQDKINKITELVKATIGYNQSRGDKVTVVNSSYNMTKQELITSNVHVWDSPWFWDVIKKIIGIILGFAFLFFLYKNLPSFVDSVQKPRKFASKLAAQGALDVKASDVEESDEEGIRPDGMTKEEGFARLKELAQTDPNRVALIIKNWVGKG